MFIDKSNCTYDEIDSFKKELNLQEYHEIIHFYSIDELWNEIKRNATSNIFKKYFACFNGKFILFEKDNFNMKEDDVYKFITGLTKKEKEEKEKELIDEYHRKENEWKKKIPSLIPEYIEKGHKILDEKYWDIWEKCVPIRLDDLYHGFELDACLEIIEMSNQGKTFEDIEKKFYEQGHSGMSYSLTRAMFKELSDKGKEFYEWSIKKENKRK